ncbi:centrosomal protein POC5 isoform X1 [Sparus aurata]|uniref:centrosomal protein POC5 isoform X1 n=1 Tax=Sparus aurata TaxID=8175 RepID=UPI0011C10CE7|nr:centrosomal protein POC5 isoform X1 [Sparus aurata]XP_030274328.1 centrosomal protein POC5 isoform X1 [Sparus aurata]XP_030274329.1 centrosomal protein POC5 isoform X1 [Sparus aurata]
MSSDEEEPTSPVLPRDSDRGSSVSSELQDEYEELLRYAVVTPKFETLTSAHLKHLSTSYLSADGRTSHRKDDIESQRPADTATEAKDGRHSSRSSRSQASPLIVEPSTHLRASHAEEMAGRSYSRASVLSHTLSDRLHKTPERSRSNSPDPLESAVTEMFISEENMSRMENILDTWSINLKSNVLNELRKWKLAFKEQHKLEMRKERERYAAQTSGLKSELESLKGLLQTYETSNQRKDEVIVNLSQVLDRQKEKLEKMKAFTNWRLKHTEAKEEYFAAQAAQQHYNMQLKKKVWLGWHSLVQKHWKVKVERACRARAEEVCTRLSAEYEAKLAEHCETVERTQAEIQRLRLERERYEESMKKAFMRGVCALNMEALTMFHTTEGQPEEPPEHQHVDEPGSATLTHLQPYPISSTRFSPVHFDRLDPSHSEVEDTVGSGAPVSRAEVHPPTTVVHGSLGGTASSHKQVSGRVVTASQQKPSKTVTARITARTDIGKIARSNLQVMGVAPPMSSVVVERHHPVTQLTVGQATAAKFPHSSQQGRSSTRGRSPSKTHTSTCHVHSIKVVD